MTKPRNEPVTQRDRQLVADAAGTAALLLRNQELNVELEARSQELKASRARLIVAQDNEWHRLERDLHDGAQQRVAALRVKLSIAETLAAREDASELESMISTMGEEAQHGIDALGSVIVCRFYRPSEGGVSR